MTSWALQGPSCGQQSAANLPGVTKLAYSALCLKTWSQVNRASQATGRLVCGGLRHCIEASSWCQVAAGPFKVLYYSELFLFIQLDS